MKINHNSLIQNIHKIINKEPKTNTRHFSQTNSPSCKSLGPVNFYQPYNNQRPNFVKLGVKQSSTGDEFHVYQLSTGQKIAITQNNETPSISLVVNKGGMQEDPKHAGISHLLEHSLFHGTKKYPKDFEKELEKDGIFLFNATTSANQICSLCNIVNKNPQSLFKAIDAQADMLFNPTFSNFESEKNTVKNEALEYEVRESNILYNAALKALYNLHDIKPIDILAGNSDTIDAIKIEDLRNYHQKLFVPENTCVIINSSLNPDDLIHYAAKCFIEASPKETKPTEEKQLIPTNSMQRIDYISKTDEEKTVDFYFAVPKNSTNKQKASLECLLDIFSKRFSFTYSVDNANSSYLTVKISSTCEDKTNNENEIYNQLQTALQQIIITPPSEDELTISKNSVSNNLSEYLKDPLSKAKHISEEIQEKVNLKFQNFESEIRNLTVTDILNSAKYLDLNKCVMTVKHPKDTTTQDIQNNYEQSKSNVVVKMLPKNTQEINILTSLDLITLEKNQISGIKTTTLPDNTNLILTNSKTDKCEATWELYNPDMKNTNPAIPLILSHMENLNPSDNRGKRLNNINSKATFGTDKIILSTSAPSKFLAKSILDLRKNFELYLTEKELKTAKENALSNIKLFKNSAYDNRLEEVYGAKYCSDSKKLEEAINNLSLNDIRKYINDILTNSYSTMIVNAPFENNLILANEIASNTNIPNYSFRKKDANSHVDNFKHNSISKCYISEEECEQPTYKKIYTFKVSGNTKDEAIFNILNKALSKNLYEDLREKQNLCYTPSAYYSNDGNTSEIELTATSGQQDKNSIEKIINGFETNIEKLKRENISEEELKTLKDELKNIYTQLYNSTDSPSDNLLEVVKMPLGIHSLQNLLEEIDKISADDIRIAANYVFNEKPDFVVMANKNVLDNNKDLFEKLGKIVK